MSLRTALLAVSLAATLVSQTGCASSAAVKAAERGDWPALRDRLAKDKRAIDGGEARAIARAVVSHEVKSAKPEDAVARLDELRSCLAKVDDVVGERAKTHDLGGARAAFLLVDAGLVGASRWVSEASSEEAAWRAVGARSLVDANHAARRRELFLDLDARVRRGALYASGDAADHGDQAALLEAVRLDPDTLARDAAIRAVGALGGRDVVLALRDRWSTADDAARASIASAWATPASLAQGGRDQLVTVAEVERGVPAITAANALLRADDAAAAIGRGALARAIDDGPTDARVVAINLAAMSDPVLAAAVKKASEAPDRRVKVAALARLSQQKETRAAALEELGGIAAGTFPESNAARTALAQAGDRRVVALLEGDLGATEPGVRAWAAAELAGMKEWPSAAPALADADASVRTRAACSVLAVRRLRGVTRGADPRGGQNPSLSVARDVW